MFREIYFQNVRGSKEGTVTWEFPLLAKYRMSHGPLSPFLEAGPSFRTTGNLNSNPTHNGIAAGGGVEFHIKQFSITPTLRYTRWASNSDVPAAKTDQLELLVGFGLTSDTRGLPFSKRLAVGAILGTNLLGDYKITSSTNLAILESNLVVQSTSSSASGSHTFSAGPTMEVRIVRGFSVEADAIYRTSNQTTFMNFGGQVSHFNFSTSAWQFPCWANCNFPATHRC